MLLIQQQHFDWGHMVVQLSLSCRLLFLLLFGLPPVVWPVARRLSSFCRMSFCITSNLICFDFCHLSLTGDPS